MDNNKIGYDASGTTLLKNGHPDPNDITHWIGGGLEDHGNDNDDGANNKNQPNG